MLLCHEPVVCSGLCVSNKRKILLLNTDAKQYFIALIMVEGGGTTIVDYHQQCNLWMSHFGIVSMER